MSFRSSLAAPSTQSGNIGTTIIVAPTVGALTSTIGTTVASVTLSKGLWYIIGTTNVSIALGVTVTEIVSVLRTTIGATSVEYIRSLRDPQVAAATTAIATEQYSDYLVLNVTADGTLIENTAKYTFTGGAVTVALPINSVAGALYCVKLA